MSAGDWFDLALRIAFALGVPGVVIWYVRDRRKSRASDEVAERTVGADVRLKDVGALGAQIAYVERAFEVERESKDRQIADQDRQIAQLTGEVRRLTDKDRDNGERIAALRDEVAALKDQVTQLLSSRLTDDHPPATP